MPLAAVIRLPSKKAQNSVEELPGDQYSFAIPRDRHTMQCYGSIDSFLFNKKLEGIIDLFVIPVSSAERALRIAALRQKCQLERNTAENATQSGSMRNRTLHSWVG